MRYLLMLGGFFCMATGAVLILNANLGVPPWDVFHLGLTLHLNISYGQAIQGVGFLAIILSWLLGTRPRLGTLLNMFFIGLFVDLIIKAAFIPAPALIPLRVAQLMAGTALFAYGTAGYIFLNRGTGPRDSLMVAFSGMTKQTLGTVRTAMEVTVTIAGLFLGGPLGWGTIVFALLVGPFLELCFRLLRWQKKTLLRANRDSS